MAGVLTPNPHRMAGVLWPAPARGRGERGDDAHVERGGGQYLMVMRKVALLAFKAAKTTERP